MKAVWLGMGCVALMAGTALANPAQLADAPSYSQAVYHALAATVALGKNDTLTAGEHILGVLAEDPDNLTLRRQAFEVSLLNGDVPTAVRLARTLPAGMGNDTLPLMVRAMVEAHEGRVAAARATVHRAARISPDFLQFRLMESYLDLAAGQPAAKVVKALQKTKMPQEFQARRHYHIARIWLKSGNLAKARAELTQANALEPGALFTTLLLADLNLKEGKTAEAEALYATFRQANPSVPLLTSKPTPAPAGSFAFAGPSSLERDLSITLFDFGLMVWVQGAGNVATQMVNLALWLDPTDPFLTYYSAVVDESNGRNTLATQRLQPLASNPAVGLAANLRLATIAFKQAAEAKNAKAMAAAVQTMGQLANANPTIPSVHHAWADMAFDAKDFPTAQTAYQRTWELVKDNPSHMQKAALLYARGATEERLGNYTQAADYLQQSLAINPVNPQVLNYLGYMWVENGQNLPQANALLQKAMMLAPTDGAILDSVGWALYMQKDYGRARLYIEQAMELEPDDATVISHLGDVYQALGRPEDAEQQWKKALTLLEKDDPDNLTPTLKRKLGQTNWLGF